MITVIHLRDSPFVGGPEKQILGQCARLDRSRYDPLIVSFGGGKSNALSMAARELGLRTALIADGKVSLPSAVKQFRELIRANGECVVISSGFKADFTAALACARVPWVVWFHGYTAATARVRAYEAMDLRVIRRAKRIIAVCEAAARRLRGLGLRKVVVIPNAIDAKLIARQGSRESARRELGVGEDDLVVGTASRLSIEKGIRCLIDSAPKVLAQHPGVRFVIVGDGPLRGDLERGTVELGVAKSFEFTGFREDAVSLIKAMDVFVLPSLAENMPVALLEAMACGVSVVATDVGGVREALANTKSEPIASGCVAAISAAVNSLLGDSQLREEHAVTLARRAAELSFERQVLCVEELIESVACIR